VESLSLAPPPAVAEQPEEWYASSRPFESAGVGTGSASNISGAGPIALRPILRGPNWKLGYYAIPLLWGARGLDG